MERIFGLDLGTTSLGWAVIDLAPDRGTGRLLPGGLGVRIFPEARDPEGTPLNQRRRKMRTARRQLRRRKARRKALAAELVASGLLPEANSPARLALDRTDPYQLRAEGLAQPLTPHQFGRALYHLLRHRQFAEREFLAERGDEEEDEDDTVSDSDQDSDPDSRPAKKPRRARKLKQAKPAAKPRPKQLRADINEKLKQTGQTLGQYLYAERAAPPRQGEPPEAKPRRRNTHATRAIIQAEYERLWAAQRQHASGTPPHLDPAWQESIATIGFAQKPVFWRPSTLGTCRFCPGQALASKASWLSRQKRMLEKLNHLEIAGGNARPLDAAERQAILERLQYRRHLTWPQVRQCLAPLFAAAGEAGVEKKLKFNLELGGEKNLLGNELDSQLMAIFEHWPTHPRRDALRQAIPTLLFDGCYKIIGDAADSTKKAKSRIAILRGPELAIARARARATLIADHAISEAEAEALIRLKMPGGFEPFSTEALEKFLPELEAGTRFGTLLENPFWEDWRETTFPDRTRPTGEILPRLPSAANSAEERARLAALRNPTVTRCQNELRKVVNNLIAVFGKPDRIRIELAREIGLSKKKRQEMIDGRDANERARKKAESELKKKDILTPSRRDIDKYLLWEECGKICPYTGDPIGFDALFRRGEFEIEHIWPRSICFDDGLRNKTLCRRDLNNHKGSKIPYDLFANDPEGWAQLCRRLDRMKAKAKGEPGMSPGKIKRFVARQIDPGFTARQLVDTSYAGKESLRMLKRLWPDLGKEGSVHVETVSGRVTAHLRRYWQLHDLLGDGGEKNRADHRHHAVDALVVACCAPAMTTALSEYFKEREDHPEKGKPQILPPWTGLRDHAIAALDPASALEAGRCLVSHRVRRKISGPLHKEQPAFDSGERIKDGRLTYGIFTRRQPAKAVRCAILDVSDPSGLSRTVPFYIPDKGLRDRLRAQAERNLAARVAKKPEPDDEDEQAGNAKKKNEKPLFPPHAKVSDEGPEIRKLRVRMKNQPSLMIAAMNGYVEPGETHHIALYRAADGTPAFEVVSRFEAAKRLSQHQPVIRRARQPGDIFIMSLCKCDAVRCPTGANAGIWFVDSIASKGQVVLRNPLRPKDQTYAPRAGTIIDERYEKLSIDPIGRIRIAHD